MVNQDIVDHLGHSKMGNNVPSFPRFTSGQTLYGISPTSFPIRKPVQLAGQIPDPHAQIFTVAEDRRMRECNATGEEYVGPFDWDYDPQGCICQGTGQTLIVQSDQEHITCVFCLGTGIQPIPAGEVRSRE